MKRPAFQFYVESWMANAKLRRCSWGARGVWAAVLCVLHDSDDEYGVVRYPLAELAKTVGCPIKFLRELVFTNVLKGSDEKHDGYVYRSRHAGKEGPPVTLVAPGPGPCWYSSRMVTDEYKRKNAGASTRFAATDPVDNSSPAQRQGDDHGENPGTRFGHGAIALDSDSVSINIGVEGDINAGPREPHPSGKGLPKVNGNGKAKPPAGWHRSDEGIDKAGRMLGMTAKRGEGYPEYMSRIFAKLGEAKRV